MGVVSKFESKRSTSLDFIGYCVFKDFDTPSQNGHKVWTQPPTSMKCCKSMPYMYILKVNKFWVSAYLCLGSVEEIIESDANLYHSPRNRATENHLNTYIYIYQNSKMICIPYPSQGGFKIFKMCMSRQVVQKRRRGYKEGGGEKCGKIMCTCFMDGP